MNTQCNRLITAVALALMAASLGVVEGRDARAQVGPPGPVVHQSGGVDSEHMFGFVTGSDIGAAGEVEIEAEQDSGAGKRAGRYYAASNAVQLKYTVIENFRVSPYVLFGHHGVGAVPGMTDIDGLSLAAGGVEFKYRALNRASSPFGLTFAVDAGIGRIDMATGQRARDYALDFSAALDRELINDRLFGAINLSYAPAWTQDVAGGGDWGRSAVTGVGAAMVTRIGKDVFAGGEVRYLRAYDSANLSNFTGDAVFAGPSVYVMLTPTANMTFAWNTQIRGHARGETGHLDLTNFERHQFRVRVGVGFAAR